jgi:hypothetical protein
MKRTKKEIAVVAMRLVLGVVVLINREPGHKNNEAGTS